MLLFYTITVGINSFFRYNRFHQEYSLKHKRYNELKKRHDKIDNMINELGNTAAWETLSRKKLKMIKKDETVLKFYYEESN